MDQEIKNQKLKQATLRIPTNQGKKPMKVGVAK